MPINRSILSENRSSMTADEGVPVASFFNFPIRCSCELVYLAVRRYCADLTPCRAWEVKKKRKQTSAA